jgi:hypothetical protein
MEVGGQNGKESDKEGAESCKADIEEVAATKTSRQSS